MRYSVQKCDEVGKNTGDPLEIWADSEIEAAEKAKTAVQAPSNFFLFFSSQTMADMHMN